MGLLGGYIPPFRTVSRDVVPVAAGQNIKGGEFACINEDGFYEVDSEKEGLICVGFFLEPADNTDGADGEVEAHVKFCLGDMRMVGVDSATDAPAQADVGSLVYLDGGRVLTTDATGRSPAGRLMSVTGPLGPEFIPLGMLGPEGPQGPAGG